MDEHFQRGDRIERTDTGRRGMVVNGESLFVVLVQWDSNSGEEQWVPASLLRNATINSQSYPAE